MAGTRILCLHETSGIIIAVLVFLFVSSSVRSTPFNGHSKGADTVLFITTSTQVKWPSSDFQNSTKIPPEICSFAVQSDIKYRYSRTLITSRVANKEPHHAQEVTFSVILPDTGFISSFIMEINGVAFEAYVREKEQAKMDYAQARQQGQSSGLIEKNTGNSNIFNINVNVEPESKVTFNLTYEELLVRKLGLYEQAININPDQVVSIKDYQIVVNIEESQNLALVRVPILSNNIDAHDNRMHNSDVVVEREAPNKAKISWRPKSGAQQRQLVKGSRFPSKFLVQYDIDRTGVADAGQVLVTQRGYFVHFFSPENLPPLRKHVVFLLDVSVSMSGRRIEQLKKAQIKILGELTSADYFNVITFSQDANIWSTCYSKNTPFPATPENVDKAKQFIASLSAGGGSNLHWALTQALSLIRSIKEAQMKNESFLPADVQSMILLFTDGKPTIGVTTPSEILTRIQFANQNLHIPIYSVVFGGNADFLFLKKLSLQNNGFARKNYGASDAALQLERLYAEISTPLLSNVKFNYTSDKYLVTDITATRFPAAFSGAEIVVAGKLKISETKPSQVNGRKRAAVRKSPPGRVQMQHSIHLTATWELQIEDVGCGGKPDCMREQPNLHRLNVNVRGLGRNASIELHSTEFFKQLSPHHAAVDPIPPAIHIPNNAQFFPKSPTPHTSEDTVLERLWAYLIISQAIENDSSAHTDVPPSWGVNSLASNGERQAEGAKEKAIRLALRYGFVTALTSLVVVNPNSSEVTNALPMDGQSNPFDSLSEQIQPFRNFYSPTGRPGGANSPSNLYSHSSTGTGGSYSSGDSYLTNVNQNANKHDNLSTSSTPGVHVNQATRMSFLPTQPSTPKMTLGDITWLHHQHSYMIRVKGTQYTVATSVTFGDNGGYECINSGTGLEGRCEHLRDCVLPAFLNDKNTFIDSYFCGISSTLGHHSKLYAGVCCSAHMWGITKPRFVSPMYSLEDDFGEPLIRRNSYIGLKRRHRLAKFFKM